MSISYGMEKRFEDASNHATRTSCKKMLKKNNNLGCAGFISRKACCMLTVSLIILNAASPSQARFLIHKKSEEPQSTLIAFPRVGRSVSDDEYNMFDDQNAERRESNGIIASNILPSLEVPNAQFSKRIKIHTRASKGSMMAFPRVGKRSPTNRIMKLLSNQARDYEQEQWSDDQGLKEAVRSNDLYQFLHSMLNEIAKLQQEEQNGPVDLGGY